ncbi:MAG: glycosyltransferase family 39 protein [Candidatus Omnitrophica bacterium]|nr:glycosyltransferase family 39 protein [Candidatus Omnitrophota bacterium]
MPVSESRRDFFCVALILLVSLSFHILYLADYTRTTIYPVAQYSDAHYYYRWGVDISEGDLPGNRVFMKWPLYAYFLGALFKISQQSVFFVYQVQALLGALSLCFVFLIGRRLYNRPVGLLAAGLCLWYGKFLFFDALLLYTTLTIFLNLLLCLRLLSLKKPFSARQLCAVGVFSGVCMLAQGNSILFAGLAVFWLILRQRLRRARTMQLCAAFTLGVALVILPVTLRNYAVGKDFVPVAGNMGINFYIGNNPGADGLFYCPEYISCNQEGMFRDAKAIARQRQGRKLKLSEVSRFWLRKGLSFIKNNPLKALGLYARKLAYIFSVHEPGHDLEYPRMQHLIGILRWLLSDLRVILPFGFLGILLNRRRFHKDAVLYAGVAAFSLSLLFFFVTTRYRIVYVPFMAVFAGAGIYGIREAGRLGRLREATYMLLGAGMFYVLLSALLLPQDTYARQTDRQVAVVQHLITEARRAAAAGEGSKAALLARAARLEQPNHYIGLLMEGHIQRKLGNEEEAERLFLDTIHWFPYSVFAHQWLGELYNKQGRFEEACRILARGEFLDEENPWIQYELGRALAARGKTQEADAAFQRALDNVSYHLPDFRRTILSALRGLYE